MEHIHNECAPFDILEYYNTIFNIIRTTVIRTTARIVPV